MRTIGIDVSLNHMGLVMLDESSGFFFSDWVTDQKKYQIKNLQYDFFFYSEELSKLKRDYKGRGQHEVLDQKRLLLWDRIGRWLAEIIKQDYPGYQVVAIENYAYQAQSRSAYQIGEVGGLIRRWIGQTEAKLRLLSPQQVKKWAVGNGNAKKSQMVGAAQEACDRLSFLSRITERKGSDLDGPGTDVADAYWLADLAMAEHQLRVGTKRMDQFKPEQIEVFNMVSQGHPVNLLAMPYC